jgi:O-antigen/teichoic acid export membrane protein
MLLSLYGLATVAGSLIFSGFKTVGCYAFGAFGNAMLIVVETGLSLALVLCGGSIVAAALGLLVGRLIGAICQALWLARLAPWLPIGVRRARSAALRELIAPASAVMLIPIAQACLLQGTAMALGAAAGQAAVPAFTTVRTLSRVGQQFGWALNAALLPEASKALGRRAEDTLALMAFGTLATSALLILPFAAAFVLFGPAFIASWTRGIVLANGLTIGAMAASLVAGGFWNPLANLLVSVDRQATFAGPYLILALLTVPASYVLALRFGAAGPALALAASDALMLALIGALTIRDLAPLPALAEAARRARGALAEVSQRPLRRRA